MITSAYTAKCHLCGSVMAVKKSEDRGWVSTYCGNCLTQVSMRGRKGQKIFVDRYVKFVKELQKKEE